MLNIAAVLNMLVIGWRLTVDPNNVSTTYHALSCVAMGFTTPPWTPFALESLYRRNYKYSDVRLSTAVSWGTTANLSMYPLAALLVRLGDAYLTPNHEYAGFWITMILDALLFIVVLAAPMWLPDISRIRMSPPKNLVRPSRQTVVLILGLVLLGACMGAVGSGLLGFSLIHGSMNLFMAMVATGMWGGYMGDAPYYRNAFMVPVIIATLYFALGHLYGYLWRSEHEEQLTPLSETARS